MNNSAWFPCSWNSPRSDTAFATGRDRLPLPPKVVDLWWGDLDWSDDLPAPAGLLNLERAYRSLSPEEQQRADRLVQDPSQGSGRSQFIRGRAQLRWILSGYLGQAAETIALTQTGKPRLVDGSLQFNLSHCQNRVIYAVGHQPIGIDLERADRPVRSPVQLAQRFLGPGEIAAIVACEPDRQREIFLKHWVCKEAAIKAQGQGLADNLKGDHVQLKSEPRLTIGAPWQLITLQPDLNHWAAIVHHGLVTQLRTYQLNRDGGI